MATKGVQTQTQRQLATDYSLKTKNFPPGSCTSILDTKSTFSTTVEKLYHDVFFSARISQDSPTMQSQLCCQTHSAVKHQFFSSPAVQSGTSLPKFQLSLSIQVSAVPDAPKVLKSGGGKKAVFNYRTALGEKFLPLNSVLDYSTRRK